MLLSVLSRVGEVPLIPLMVAPFEWFVHVLVPLWVAVIPLVVVILRNCKWRGGK